MPAWKKDYGMNNDNGIFDVEHKSKEQLLSEKRNAIATKKKRLSMLVIPLKLTVLYNPKTNDWDSCEEGEYNYDREECIKWFDYTKSRLEREIAEYEAEIKEMEAIYA